MSELSPHNPNQTLFRDKKISRVKKAVAAVALVAATGTAFLVDGKDPRMTNARDAEKEAIEHINAPIIPEDRAFYMEEAVLKPNGKVRSEPKIVNDDSATAKKGNIVERPDHLAIADGIVVSNEDGNWLGFDIEPNESSEATSDMVWVHEDALEKPLDEDMIVEFDVNEYPHPHGLDIKVMHG